jgi:IS1 family transposase
VILQRRKAEVDALCSFVGTKANRPWVGSARDATTRHVSAFHVGDRSAQSATALGERRPAVEQERATFSTEPSEVDKGVLPSVHPRALTKRARTTTQGERFNCT